MTQSLFILLQRLKLKQKSVVFVLKFYLANKQTNKELIQDVIE